MSEKVARRAFEGLERIKQDFQGDERAQGRILTLARKLPAMLQVNGLGQTVAFLYSKCGGIRYEGAEGRLLQLLDDLIRLDEQIPGPADPVQRVLNMDPTSYRVATQRAMTSALWIKRLAEGLIEAAAEEQ